jgi:transcriptional antiterminator Rof (Rho-off)
MNPNEKPHSIVPSNEDSASAPVSSPTIASEKSEYKPIACSVYDVFEVAALRRKTLMLTVGGRSADYIMEDVYAKGQEEFLKALLASTGEQLTVKLDSTDLIVDPSNKKSYYPYPC